MNERLVWEEAVEAKNSGRKLEVSSLSSLAYMSLDLLGTRDLI